jgi:CPA2 family monovalent cation:H+ antiporter-2
VCSSDLVVLRSHNAEEADRWRAEHAGTVFVGEQELARAMSAHVLHRVHGVAALSPSSVMLNSPPAVPTSPAP